MANNITAKINHRAGRILLHSCNRTFNELQKYRSIEASINIYNDKCSSKL